VRGGADNAVRARRNSCAAEEGNYEPHFA